MRTNHKKSMIRMAIIVILCAWSVWAITVEQGSPGKAQSNVQSQQAQILSLHRFGFFGFGDFQGQELRQRQGYFLQLMMNDTLRTWSGYTREWKGGEAFPLNGFNTLAVTVEGAEDNFEFRENKMMSWIIQYDGSTGDVALICSDSTVWSNDRTFVGPVDATFEYPLPQRAIERGAIKKVGITLVKGARYRDVKMKAYFIRR